MGPIVHMMTSSNGNISRVAVTGPLCGEFTGPGEFPAQRPMTRSFDVFFDLRLNKRLSKQSWGWLLETLSPHYDAIVMFFPRNMLEYWPSLPEIFRFQQQKGKEYHKQVSIKMPLL